jgi:hypothetical protein
MENLTVDANSGTEVVNQKSERSVKSSKTKSNKSSKTKSNKSVKSDKKPPKQKININTQESIELSMSELGILANKEKINDNTTMNVPKERSYSRKKSHNSERSSKSSDSDTYSPPKRYKKDVKKENKDPEIRKKKLDFLFKISQFYKVYYNKENHTVSMENTLDDIEIEYNRISNEIQRTKGIDVAKTMLTLTIQGLEMANNRFDPIGVDLHGWSQSMAYSIQSKDYEEVLGELYEKYKHSVTVMPEIKLILMIAGSAAMFAWTKKMAKSDPTEMFSKMFNKKETQEPTRHYEESASMTDMSSAKIDEPEENTTDINEILDKMNKQKQTIDVPMVTKRRGGRPVGSKNKKKTNVILV